jgi:hypothetical protein
LTILSFLEALQAPSLPFTTFISNILS